MRVGVVRCASCNTIVPAPTVRSRNLTCEACIAKRRKVLYVRPRLHHICLNLKEEPDDDGHDDADDDNPLLGHWPG